MVQRKKKRERLRLADWLFPLLLVLGIALLLYPTVSNWIASRNHSKAIVEYAVTVEELARQEIIEQFDSAEQYNKSLAGLVVQDAFLSDSGHGVSAAYLSALNIGGMIGYVEIPKIDVSLPVYHTTSDEVLRKGVGHLPESALPIGEETGHTVLTAHRGLPSAKLFTDLNKLEDGDVFQLTVLDKTLYYQVDQIVVVEPHETEELQPLPGENYTTLITCTPYAINSHRLLVRGVLIAQSSGELPSEVEMEENEKQAGYKIWMLLPVLTAIVVLLVWSKKRR